MKETDEITNIDGMGYITIPISERDYKLFNFIGLENQVHSIINTIKKTIIINKEMVKNGISEMEKKNLITKDNALDLKKFLKELVK